MKLLGIDPGGGTGWATWSKGNGFGKYGQLGPGPHYVDLWNLLNAIETDLIICETFDLHKANEAVEPISLEYEGVVKTFAELTKTGLVMQQAGAKEWADDRKLHKLGLYHTHHDRHAADARRHILYFLAHNKYINREVRVETLRLLK